MQKNDEIELEIIGMGSEGEGIGRYEGMALFVKGAIVGDRIVGGITKLKKTYGYARLIKILEPSKDRVEPPCPYSKRCGGCQLQPMSYEAQLNYKQQKVREDLLRLGEISQERFDKGEIEFFRTLGMENPSSYRNKGQYPVGTDREGHIVSGFYAGHTHTIIDSERCMIQHELADRMMAGVRLYMERVGLSAYDEEAAAAGRRDAGLVRHVLTRIGFVTHEVMVCVVINGKELKEAGILKEILDSEIEKYNKSMSSDAEPYKLTSLSYNINTDNTNVIMGKRIVTVFGSEYITDHIGDVRFRISPLSFYQVNPVQTVRLYGKALEFAELKGGETVWDLYCGIGTISLFMAGKAGRVYGVEIVPEAIADAKENAKLNKITNAEFFVGAAEEVLPAKYAQNPQMKADVIVVDPPRKGCDASLIDCMIKLAPQKIVYVSCDPATLSRDVALLEKGGYRLKKVQPVDMFPFSGHVESVCLLSKKS